MSISFSILLIFSIFSKLSNFIFSEPSRINDTSFCRTANTFFVYFCSSWRILFFWVCSTTIEFAFSSFDRESLRDYFSFEIYRLYSWLSVTFNCKSCCILLSLKFFYSLLCIFDVSKAAWSYFILIFLSWIPYWRSFWMAYSCAIFISRVFISVFRSRI